MTKAKYSKYKPSKTLWQEQIPSHWQEIELRMLFADNKNKNIGLTERNLLSLSYGKLKRKDIDNATGLVPASFEGYQIIDEGYIVLRFTDLQNDKKSLRVGYAKERGIITNAYVGLAPKADIFSKYFYYQLHFLDKIKYFYNLGGGVRQSLAFKELGRETILVPQKEEQIKIASFLDFKLAKIERFIRKKKELIKLLNEQKAAMVDKLVSKGLNEKSQLKPSGLDWLGNIPINWKLIKLKYVAEFNPSKSTSGYTKNSNDLVVFLPMEKVSEDGRIDNSIKLPISNIWEGYTYFKRGDVVYAKITPCFENGKGAYLSELETEIGFGTTELSVLRPKLNLILGEYLHLILNSKTFLLIGEKFMEGAAGQKRVPTDFVKNFTLAIPDIAEQQEIIEHKEVEISKVNLTISIIEKEIALTEEYKTSIIAEAVTGKIDIGKYEILNTREKETFEELEEELNIAAEEEAEYIKQEME